MKRYIVRVIKNLPEPQNLVEFSLNLTYYVQGFPTIDDCTQPFKILETLLEPIFLSLEGLKKVRVSLQLSSAAGPSTGEIQAVKNPFPILAQKKIQIEAFTSA